MTATLTTLPAVSGRDWCPECWGSGTDETGEPCDGCVDAATVELLGGGWLGMLTNRLVDELREEGDIDPLREPLTLAAVLHDLFRLAGVEAPEAVRAALQ